METAGTTGPSAEAQALNDWQAATLAVSAYAAKSTLDTITEESFDEMRRLRAVERAAWQRCRPHWAA